MNIERYFAFILGEELKKIGFGAQKELADAIGITKGAINNILKGRRGTDEDTRRKISGILKIDYEKLIRDYKDIPDDQNEIIQQVALCSDYSDQSALEREMDEKLKIILRSKSMHKTSIVHNIRSFYTAVIEEERMGKLEDNMAEMKEMMRKMMEMKEQENMVQDKKRDLQSNE